MFNEDWPAFRFEREDVSGIEKSFESREWFMERCSLGTILDASGLSKDLCPWALETEVESVEDFVEVL